MTASPTGLQGGRATELTGRQWGIILVVAALQFVNILDFVIVMPIGPRLSTALSFPASHLPWMNGSYTATASLMGLLGALFLDRFDRRKAVGVAVAGLVIGTALCGFASDFTMLLVARSVAGAFGGPATSLCFAIIADTIPNEIRGKAMGTVMGAFSVASVFGVPAGLWLAEHVGWRAPFFVVAGLGAVVMVGGVVLLPPLTGHVTGKRRTFGELFSLVREPDVQLSYLMTAVVMAAGFILIPNIASYLQFNLGVPEATFARPSGDRKKVARDAFMISASLGARVTDTVIRPSCTQRGVEEGGGERGRGTS
jgi:predicted MFS family arabinose efflux permease